MGPIQRGMAVDYTFYPPLEPTNYFSKLLHSCIGQWSSETQIWPLEVLITARPCQCIELQMNTTFALTFFLVPCSQASA